MSVKERPKVLFESTLIFEESPEKNNNGIISDNNNNNNNNNSNNPKDDMRFDSPDRTNTDLFRSSPAVLGHDTPRPRRREKSAKKHKKDKRHHIRPLHTTEEILPQLNSSLPQIIEASDPTPPTPQPTPQPTPKKTPQQTPPQSALQPILQPISSAAAPAEYPKRQMLVYFSLYACPHAKAGCLALFEGTNGVDQHLQYCPFGPHTPVAIPAPVRTTPSSSSSTSVVADQSSWSKATASVSSHQGSFFVTSRSMPNSPLNSLRGNHALSDPNITQNKNSNNNSSSHHNNSNNTWSFLHALPSISKKEKAKKKQSSDSINSDCTTDTELTESASASSQKRGHAKKPSIEPLDFGNTYETLFMQLLSGDEEAPLEEARSKKKAPSIFHRVAEYGTPSPKDLGIKRTKSSLSVFSSQVKKSINNPFGSLRRTEHAGEWPK